MIDIVKYSLFVTFVLSTTWKSTNSYNIDYRHYLGNDNVTSSRFKRQSSEVLPQCTGDPKTEYQCASMVDCINMDAKCNGKKDCPDGSDEKESVCKDVPCAENHYKCEYGACIEQNLRCDGVKDCIDGSDEFGCVPKKNCSYHHFSCNNGQCIRLHLICNAIPDCKDKSDETEELCLDIICPNNTYTCKYGACAGADSKCNNIQDCPDNSDEQNCGGKETSLQPSDEEVPIGDKCMTPPQPQNGQWTYVDNTIGRANEKVNPNTVITFSCMPGYKLSSSSNKQYIILCLPTGGWTEAVMPTCQKLCKAFENTEIITYSCKTGRSFVPCDMATDLTVVTFECARFYEIPAGRPDRSICYDGTWDYTPECVAVCGEKRVTAEILIVNGQSVKRGNYPWVAAIYSNKETSPKFTNICGGSLLKVDIILTAAHCVTYKETGKIIHQKFYRVGAGKYFNSYEDERDKDTAQYSKIEEIVVSPEFKGELQNFRGDIALLRLKKQFTLSEVVQPVCFQYLPHLRPRTYGLVTGWGFTISTGQPSDTLKELELPYNDEDQCFNDLDPEFANRYFIPDKMCAGFSDKNTSVCKGDSGSGLVFKNENYRYRYFIHGIVSLAHSFAENQEIHCNIQRSALFTRVEYYLEWIQIEMKKWTPKRGEDKKRLTFLMD